MANKPLRVLNSEANVSDQAWVANAIAGRCATCQFWIDAEAMEHVPPFLHQRRYNVFSRECWAENPANVPPDRRVKTGPHDLCRHWQQKHLPGS